MKAFVLTSLDAPPALGDLPAPQPADGEVLVRVHASSVNPVDNSIAAGVLQGMFEHDFPVTLGRDYAGVVEEGGTSWARGDEVYGFVLHANPNVHDGSWAELIASPEDNFIARAPASVDLAVAGAAPLAGITAMAAIDALELSQGDRLLVVGATGGVGSFAVQLAAKAGAHVIAPALPDDERYLRDLGVAEVVERGTIAPADALLDVVSYTPDELDANAAELNDGGRAVSSVGAAGDGPGRVNVMAVPSPDNLERLAGLIDDGTLRVPIQATYRLDQAGDGLAALSGTHTQGKVALKVS